MQTSLTDLLQYLALSQIHTSVALVQSDSQNRPRFQDPILPPSDQILTKIYSTINSKQNYRTLAIQRPHKVSITIDEGSSNHSSTVKCNCKKSKCLKLYCECFSQGLFCNGCNCACCHNKEEFGDIRAKAIDQVICRAPLPFGQRSSSIKGCNCRKTGCQKKYCECFSNGEKCTEYCKCNNCCNSG